MGVRWGQVRVKSAVSCEFYKDNFIFAAAKTGDGLQQQNLLCSDKIYFALTKLPLVFEAANFVANLQRRKQSVAPCPPFCSCEYFPLQEREEASSL